MFYEIFVVKYLIACYLLISAYQVFTAPDNTGMCRISDTTSRNEDDRGLKRVIDEEGCVQNLGNRKRRKLKGVGQTRWESSLMWQREMRLSQFWSWNATKLFCPAPKNCHIPTLLWHGWNWKWYYWVKFSLLAVLTKFCSCCEAVLVLFTDFNVVLGAYWKVAGCHFGSELAGIQVQGL